MAWMETPPVHILFDLCSVPPQSTPSGATRLLASCPEPGTGRRTPKGQLSIKPLALNRLQGSEIWRLECASLSGYRENEMLRITVQEDLTLWRLHLSGRLADAWVAETENAWHSAPVSGRRVEVDLREVTGIDDAGRRLLRAMNQAGACFFAKGVAMEALVEEIAGASQTNRRRR